MWCFIINIVIASTLLLCLVLIQFYLALNLSSILLYSAVHTNRGTTHASTIFCICTAVEASVLLLAQLCPMQAAGSIQFHKSYKALLHSRAPKEGGGHHWSENRRHYMTLAHCHQMRTRIGKIHQVFVLLNVFF